MHAIRLVDDLSDGLDWAFVEDGDDRMIFYRSSALSGCPEHAARILAESWAAYRALQADAPPTPGGGLRIVARAS